MYKIFLYNFPFFNVTSKMSEDQSNYNCNSLVKWSNPNVSTISFTVIFECYNYFLLYFMNQTDKQK